MLCLVVSHRTEPLVMLPESWFFPIQKLVALPSGVTGRLGPGVHTTLDISLNMTIT